MTNSDAYELSSAVKRLLYTYVVTKDIKNVAHLSIAWAIIGLTLLLIYAIARLAPRSREAISSGLSFSELIILVIWCSYMLFTEGYMGFQRQFSPRFASRMLYLFNNPRASRVLLAPLFCMGYVGATNKRKRTIWLLTLGIICLIVGLKYVGQPWRGIIDTGVILGLVYGLVSLYVSCVRVMICREYEVDPEIKDEAE